MHVAQLEDLTVDHQQKLDAATQALEQSEAQKRKFEVRIAGKGAMIAELESEHKRKLDECLIRLTAAVYLRKRILSVSLPKRMPESATLRCSLLNKKRD